MIPLPRRIPLASLALCLALCGLAVGEARADRISNPTAVMSGLDKITGRIISFEVAVGETVQFGSLQITPRICWSRPPTEAPQTTSFLEVDEVTFQNEYRRIFTGWMYAASPGLHGIEHAIYDVWLTECKGGTEIIVEAREEPEDDPAAALRGTRPPQQRAGEPLPGPPPGGGQRIDVLPPRGVPVQPAQRPSQRYFPTNPAQQFDPAERSGR